MTVDASAVIGLLVGFLVVGLIGTYIGDQMIAATNLSQATPQEDGVYQNISAYTGFGVWAAPAGVTSVTVIVVGAGGGGANANNASMLGGEGGGAGSWSSSTLDVVPGTICVYYLGERGVKNTAGNSTNITCLATTITAAGGAAGVLGSTRNGTSGSQVSVTDFIGASSVTSATAGTGNVTNNTLGGSAAAGLGGGGGGAGAQGIAGAGGHGGVQISYTTYTDPALGGSTSQLAPSMDSVIATFVVGVLLCKIIVIVSIASIVFVLLQKTGLIPRFGQE